MPDIIERNQLARTDRGLWVPPGTNPAPFDYSDGAEVERYLRQVLERAGDLGSRSAELQAAIIDWPSEYHLSSDRANLLRPYNLGQVDRVLELGSGCGAISRYLGELGVQVDAVEGSPVRADLGRLRCRDLDNVRVINANYNDLEIPAGHYDMVLFVGVIEYARRFLDDAGSDRAAAISILSRARQCLKPGGLVFAAIENRLGLKYQLGAHEDHYGKRYIGINGYRESAGIATYSRDEWVDIIQQAGFAGSAFSYPFPDYKLPRVVLADGYLWNNPRAANHLEGLVSRDYYAPLPRSAQETIGWQAAGDGGYLRAVANSFSILMGDNADTIRQVQDFDFCHPPGPGRKACYAVNTIKPVDEARVYKRPVSPGCTPADAGVRQVLAPDPFIAGDLLAAQWLRTLLIHVRREEFEQDLKAYYDYLGSVAASGELTIDLLPINILVQDDGAWRIFDQEWQVDWKIEREYLLFRALLTFIVGNWPYLKDFLAWLELRNVRDFIEWGFHANQIHLSEHLVEFIAMENRFQAAISAQNGDAGVETLLHTVFDFSHGSETLFSAVYWCEGGEDWAEERLARIERPIDPGLSLDRFTLEDAGPVRQIRFDPFDLRRPEDTGFFHIEALSLVAVGADGERTLWRLADETAVSLAAGASSALRVSGRETACWIATTDFPKFEFDLGKAHRAEADEQLCLDVRWGVVRTAEYALAYNHCLVEAADKEKTETRARRNLASMKMIADYERDRLEDEAARLRRNVTSMQQEIDHIKASRAFRLGSGLARLGSLFRPRDRDKP